MTYRESYRDNRGYSVTPCRRVTPEMVWAGDEIRFYTGHRKFARPVLLRVLGTKYLPVEVPATFTVEATVSDLKEPITSGVNLGSFVLDSIHEAEALAPLEGAGFKITPRINTIWVAHAPIPYDVKRG